MAQAVAWAIEDALPERRAPARIYVVEGCVVLAGAGATVGAMTVPALGPVFRDTRLALFHSARSASFDPRRGTTRASIKRSMLRPRRSSAESPAVAPLRLPVCCLRSSIDFDTSSAVERSEAMKSSGSPTSLKTCALPRGLSATADVAALLRRGVRGKLCDQVIETAAR